MKAELATRKVTKIGPIKGNPLAVARMERGEDFYISLRHTNFIVVLKDGEFRYLPNGKIEVMKRQGDKFRVKSQVIVEETF